MTPKIALKRLTASDLTFFEWQFRKKNAGNQKAINLNSDVFKDELYPLIETFARSSGHKMPIDLWLLGPGLAEPINLQRKIIKGAAYKNWRLDGEFIYNPDSQPDRFNILEPGDLVILAFEGDVGPISAKAVFISQSVKQDTALHGELSATLGERGMIALNGSDLRAACDQSGCLPEHPLVGLILGEDLIDSAAGDVSATDRLVRRGSTLHLSLDDLRKARERAEEIGHLGEALVDVYLQEQQHSGEITEFVWASELNAVSPYDFSVTSKGATEKLEVKTTTGDFGRNFHVPLSELNNMAHSEVPYKIARVYNASPDGAKVRISQDYRSFGQKILSAFEGLPAGVTPDGVTIRPDDAMFGKEFDLKPPVEE